MPETGSRSISEALSLFLCLNTCDTQYKQSLGKAWLWFPWESWGGHVCEAWRSVCNWGVCHAVQCVELRAAGVSGVCSAGSAGCFYKGGEPRLHSAHTYTGANRFYLWRQRVTRSVHHASLRNMLWEGWCQCSGRAVSVASVWCLLHGSRVYMPSFLCC